MYPYVCIISRRKQIEEDLSERFLHIRTCVRTTLVRFFLYRDEKKIVMSYYYFDIEVKVERKRKKMSPAARTFDSGEVPIGVNPDLERERAGADFNVEIITNLIDGSIEGTSRRRYLESLIHNDPTGVFNNDENPYLDRTQRHVRALAKHIRLIEICRSAGIGGAKYDGEITLDPDFHTLVASISDVLPTNLHWAMFLPNILSLCDEEQQKVWLPLCRDWKMIGCYAQTEIGHGSNVRALETTATFVHESEGGGKGGSWRIHSPTLTSTKFWPGTLGRVGNHAMVIARLIDGQKVDRGIHNFLVQIRSMEEHTLMPGVITGDIGPKLGYNNMDNGFARFNNILIPRRNMAMRFASVDSNGNYSKKQISPAASKIAYVTMMQVRAIIIEGVGKLLGMACTISIRYSAVRRQGFDEKSQDGKLGKTEVQILHYKQQQHRLLPLLASSYCFYFIGKKAMADLNHMEECINQDTGSITKTRVADIHASLSALKSVTTTIASDGVEDCRKACGGHGFLQSSGLPELASYTVHTATVEGDNHMLPQQVIKVLLKLVDAIHNQDQDAINEWNESDSNYLIEPLQKMIHGKNIKFRCNIQNEMDALEVPTLLTAFQHRAARLLLEVASQIQSAIMEKGMSMQDAWNDALIQMARASRAHAMYLMLRNFVEKINFDFQTKQNHTNEKSVMMDLAVLFGLFWMEKDMSDFVEDNYMNRQQADIIRSCVIKMLDKVRPNAVALVDAWDFSDFSLRSALGRYDGHVYYATIESSKKGTLNVSEPGPGYEEHLKRLFVDGIGVYTGTASRLL